MSNHFHIGEIVLINLDPYSGAGTEKTRPCAIINVHPKLELMTVFPITDSKNKSGKVFVPIADLKAAGLSKPSAIDTYQIRSLSKNPVVKKMGQISAAEISNCRKSLALIFEIDEDHLI